MLLLITSESPPNSNSVSQKQTGGGGTIQQSTGPRGVQTRPSSKSVRLFYLFIFSVCMDGKQNKKILIERVVPPRPMGLIFFFTINRQAFTHSLTHRTCYSDAFDVRWSGCFHSTGSPSLNSLTKGLFFYVFQFPCCCVCRVRKTENRIKENNIERIVRRSTFDGLVVIIRQALTYSLTHSPKDAWLSVPPRCPGPLDSCAKRNPPLTPPESSPAASPTAKMETLEGVFPEGEREGGREGGRGGGHPSYTMFALTRQYLAAGQCAG